MTQRLSHREKRGLLIATLVLILIAGGRMLYTALTPKAGVVPTDSANISEINFPQKPTRQSHPAKVPTQLFDFDPNTADSATFIRIGLPHWMAHNALKYRRKGGRWRKAEDFKRLYGMTNERFALLEPYIKIVPPPPRNIRLRSHPIELPIPGSSTLSWCSTSTSLTPPRSNASRALALIIPKPS